MTNVPGIGMQNWSLDLVGSGLGRYVCIQQMRMFLTCKCETATELVTLLRPTSESGGDLGTSVKGLSYMLSPSRRYRNVHVSRH
jgi:hypothetical protein